MPDMLCRLMDLPDYSQLESKLSQEGINVFRPIAPDLTRVLEWVGKHSGESGKSECLVCFSHSPITAYIAEKDGKVIGYACYSSIAPDFFGPTRVDENFQKQGIGRLLLLKSLHAMKDAGYVYAIIGSVGPMEFYEKTVGAKVIDGSDPGVYRYSLKRKQNSINQVS